jgi:hypothetical protein
MKHVEPSIRILPAVPRTTDTPAPAPERERGPSTLNGVRLDLAVARRHRAQAGCDCIAIALSSLRRRITEGDLDVADQLAALKVLVDRLAVTVGGVR